MADGEVGRSDDGLAKADINRRDEHSGATALAVAAMQGDASTVRALLGDPDIDVNAANLSGDTALHVAVDHGHVDVVELLLSRSDLGINATNAIGATALMRAVDRGNERIVGLLLARPDADVNLVDVHRSTPLHHAVVDGKMEVAALLLAHPDTNLDITNRPFRQTAAEVAAQAGDHGLVELLRDAAPTHSFGDALSERDDFVGRAETGDEPIPRMPYDDEPWPRP